MKKFLNILPVILITCFFLGLSRMADAREFTLPRFQAKDAVSADMFNEIMEKIELANRPITDEELDGSWECTSRSNLTTIDDPNYSGTAWQDDEDGLGVFLSGTLNFNDGRISSVHNLFLVLAGWRDAGIDSIYRLENGRIMFKYDINDDGDTLHRIASYTIKKLGNYKILITDDSTGGSQSGSMTCDKTGLPPEQPESLSANNSGKSVTLTWNAVDDNTATYTIYRRDSLSSSFSEISTTTSTTFTDTVPANGTYWYRISGSDDNGESDKTSVVKVVVGDS